MTCLRKRCESLEYTELLDHKEDEIAIARKLGLTLSVWWPAPPPHKCGEFPSQREFKAAFCL